ncbi:MAG: insulinase family protein [Desulfosalsimonadaceae bacterium]
MNKKHLPQPLKSLPGIFLLMLVIQAAPAAAADAQTAIFFPAKQLSHKTSELRPDPALRFGSLKNGLRYILMPNDKPKNRVSMHLFAQAGSMHEKSDERGIAHYLEHMMFNGTEHFAPGELVKFFQNIGMRFGPDVNARTGFYSTVYDIDLPSGDRQSLEKGLLVLRDYAAGADIREEQVEKERGVILSEKRTRDSVSYRTFVETLSFELPEALLPKRLPIGTEKVIRSADRELLNNFYKAWYRPERMIVVMAGDYDIKTAEELIKNRFSGLSARAPLRDYPDPGKIRHKKTKSFYHHESEAGDTRVSLEVVTRRVQPADSKKIRRSRLLSGMACRIINYRLEDQLNQPDTPFTDARIDAGNYLHYVQAAEIHADCPPDKWDAALQSIEKSLRKAMNFGFTESEVQRAKKERLTELKRRVKSADTRKSGHLTRQIISSINSRRVFLSPAQEQELLAPMIEAADKKSLHAALEKDWAPSHRLVLVTGNADLSDKEKTPEKQILEVFQKSRKGKVHPPKQEADLEFPYLQPPKDSAEIAETREIEDPAVTRIKFANNIWLNIKKTDFQENRVIAALAFGAGRSGEPAKNPGLAQLAEKLINLSGVGRYSRTELNRALAGTNTSVGFRVEEDQFVFSGRSVSDEIPLLFQLLHTRMEDPGFRKKAHKLAMKRFEQQYKSWRHSIHGALLLEGRRFLAGGDSRFGMPRFSVLQKNTLKDVRNWVGPAMEKAPIEISVVGDLNTGTVIKAAKKYFGALARRSPLQNENAQRGGPCFPKGKSRSIQVPTKIRKGLVGVAYPTGDYWNIHRNRRLSVLSDVMAERIRVKIREKMGAAYSYHVYNDPSRAYPGYGIYQATVEVAPEDAAGVAAAVKEIASDLAAEGVSRDARDRAVKPALTSIRERVETNSYWLNSVLKGLYRHPEQLEWSRSFLNDYQSITAEELSRLAKKYLKNPKAASLIITPEKGANKQSPEQRQQTAAESGYRSQILP